MNSFSNQTTLSGVTQREAQAQCVSGDAPARFVLPSQLDLSASRALKEALSPYLGRTGTLLIDASSVNKMSTACIQVLLAFIMAARRSAIVVRITSTSHVFEQSIALLGLAHLFAESRP